MDSLRTYHRLSNLRKALEVYPTHKNTIQEIDNLLAQLSSKKYRVAVIGEFNRGKSSLVNSLLGVEVLPTAILPTTAVINRIVYDTKQKIVVYYKDGTVEESSLDLLKDFATKTDKLKEKTALNIRQIDVHYPSVFSQNGIELIDTPGLNEEEKMNETTLSVLDRIDTAIVVISAMMPLSLSEQELICSLIEQKDIYHLTFVVSFIDKISDDPEEQDEMVNYIEQRIKNETYSSFCKTHDDKVLLEKANYILSNPKIFGLSAKQAMDGFIKNDNALLQASRFPHFKLELSAILTASQEQDLNAKIQRMALEIYDNFTNWHNTYISQITTNLNAMMQSFEKSKRFVENSSSVLSSHFLEIENKLKSIGISYSRFSPLPSKIILQCQNVILLSSNISIEEKQKRIAEIFNNFEASVYEILTTEMNNIAKNKYLEFQQFNLNSSQFNISLSEWYGSYQFPFFNYQELLANTSTGREITNAVSKAFHEYTVKINDYCTEWRKFMFLENSKAIEIIKQNATVLDQNIKVLNAQFNKVVQHYAVNEQSVMNDAAELINQ